MTSSCNDYESLPKKRMGAGCLFFDQRDRVLLVKPSYKPVWGIPGGIIELNESPRQCCQREVLEEVGLDRAIGRLLVVDYNKESDAKTESLMFIFDGGVLSEPEIAAIHLQEAELSDFAFFSQDALLGAMGKTLRARVLAAWRQRFGNGGVYLEDQQVV